MPLKEVPPAPKPAKVAVVLGAGASKGFSHIGVLKVLEANRVPVHMIVGTSAGSFVGSLYAYGFSAYQLQKMSMSMEKGDIVDLKMPDNGFIRGEKIESYINNLIQNTPIEKLRVPFYAVTADLASGREVVFGTGNTGTAVRASCSIPGIFQPVRIGNRIYVDGGVVSPVAVRTARRYGADVVIAVDISAFVESIPQGTIETLLQAVDIMYARIGSNETDGADVVIRPKTRQIGSADFSKRHEAILEGEMAAAEAMPKIQAIISKLRAEGRL
ncbi:MAG: patatin-like phospholipase family protein [Syntrophales bacterium]|nr:patatin-like phospholipase family protein [Syntrophales bacterium]